MAYNFNLYSIANLPQNSTIHPKIAVQSPKVIEPGFGEEELFTLLLKNRSIEENLSDFLNPPHPSLKLNLKPIVDLLKQAVGDKKNILIYGDYDADGITSTALLWQALYRLNANVTPFIPNRETDGYGFKYQSFLNFQKQKKTNFGLIITVDNGIVAQKELSKLKNIDIVIVDHHIPGASRPKTKYIIHSTITSASVLSWFLASKLDKSADLGLAALGVIADCLPVTGINRNIIVHGLKFLNKHPNFGLKKLIDITGLKVGSLTAYDLGFVLGPRLNAIGRLADPTDALRLLCSQNFLQASKYSQALDNHNQQRQTLQKDTLETADKNIDIKNKLIFLSDPSFHPGIIGLVAGRLTEKYYLPSIIISENGEISKGSCRSIPNLNIIETLRQLSDFFIDLGGHPAAVGFSIKTVNIKRFQIKITNLVAKQLKNVDLSPVITVDARMKLAAANLKNAKAIEKFAPFGLGNQEPLFLFENLKIVSKRLLGSSGDHLKLVLDDPATSRIENIKTDAIAFKKGELDKVLRVGDIVNVVAKLSQNTWNGVTTPQLVIKEININNQ